MMWPSVKNTIQDQEVVRLNFGSGGKPSPPFPVSHGSRLSVYAC